MFNPLQDYLLKEPALPGIKARDWANQFLKEQFLPAFNAAFIPAREQGSAFVPLLDTRLDDMLCVQEERTVNHDNCVWFSNRILKLRQRSTTVPLCQSQGSGTRVSGGASCGVSRAEEAG